MRSITNPNGIRRLFSARCLSLFLGLLSITSARALTFNVTFDSSVTSSVNSAQIQSAFNTAAQYLQNLYTNNIVINVTVYWGSVGPFSGGIGLGASETSFVGTVTYAQMTNALRNARTTLADSNAVASLPASDPVAGNVWWFTRAQAKALGITGVGVSANDATLDGSIGFASTVSYSFDPTNRAVAGKYDFIGVAEHEITEVMGRVYFDLTTVFIPYDLFRFSGSGVRTFSTTAPSVYFSVDNGLTNLRNFNPVEANGDLTDWALSGSADACDYAISTGKKGVLSYADLTALDVIGYKLNYVPPRLTGIKSGTNFVLSFTNTPGTTYAVLTTTNLSLTFSNWPTLGTSTDSVPGVFQFTDPQTGTNKLRFYRLRLN